MRLSTVRGTGEALLIYTEGAEDRRCFAAFYSFASFPQSHPESRSVHCASRVADWSWEDLWPILACWTRNGRAMSLDHSSRQRHPRFTIDDDDHESGTDTPARASTPDAGLRDEQKRAHDGDAFSEKRTEELKADERTGGTGKAAEAFGEADGSSEEAVAPEKREDYPPSTSHSRSEDASPAATAEASTETTPNRLSRFRQRLLATSWLSWVEPHLCWRGMRPVVRASIASWCGLILMLVPRTQRMLGQASFLVLIGTLMGSQGKVRRSFGAPLRSKRYQSRFRTHRNGARGHGSAVLLRRCACSLFPREILSSSPHSSAGCLDLGVYWP